MNQNNLAPIILIVYNRLFHTKKTIEFLRNNNLASNSNLFIYSDGYKNGKDKKDVIAVRQYINNINGFKSVNIIARDRNIGLVLNITSAVTEICNQFQKVIVLEDDIVTSPFFLEYMNDGLTIYEDDDNVACIHGYLYPLSYNFKEPFFIRGADCWGWATWQRAWKFYNPNASDLYIKLKDRNLFKQFNFNNTFDYSGMLMDQINNKINSWAIRWNASIFLQNMLTLYPNKSLVKNIGFDNTGTHSGSVKYFDQIQSNIPIIMTKLPTIESKFAYLKFSEYFKKNKLYKNLFYKAIIKYLKKFFYL